MQQIIGELETSEIVRGIGTPGRKIGGRPKVLQDLLWRRTQAGTWKRGTSQEERMTQKTNLLHMWLHRSPDYEAATKALEGKLVEDYHSLTSTETTQVGHGSEVCPKVRLFNG